MKRQPYTVGELVKVLSRLDPNKQVRLWDLGYGGSVPAVEVVEGSARIFLEGATKEEMEREAFE